MYITLECQGQVISGAYLADDIHGGLEYGGSVLVDSADYGIVWVRTDIADSIETY